MADLINLKSMGMKYLLSFALLLLTSFHLLEGAPKRFFTNRVVQHKLSLPEEEGSFTFAIFGDRTGGARAGITVLEHAVVDVNVLAPDFLMTVGDLVQGYNQRPQWQKEADEYTAIMDRLAMPWFPVAGNHDIYWRGDDRPENEHEGDYEKHFGPLWYAFEHKGCCFIVLYSDEGNPATGEYAFNKPESQVMSKEQADWLQSILSFAHDAKHVFIFIHHPRWTKGGYGDDWDRIHKMLKSAGNVSAVFAGHKHIMKYDGEKDKIRYYTLGTTGGHYGSHGKDYGQWDHYDMVTVRDSGFSVAAIAVEAVVNASRNRVTTQRLLPLTSWHIKSEATRELSWPFQIPMFPEAHEVILAVSLVHGRDDVGDKGLHMQIIDSTGEVRKKSFSKSNGRHLLRLAVRSGEQYVFKIMDDDTEFTGRYPGNGGKVEISVSVLEPKYPDTSH